MVPSCSSTSENKAVINSTVIIRLSSPRRDVTPPSVEESSDDCKPKKLVPLVCKVLYMLYDLSETNTIGYIHSKAHPRWLWHAIDQHTGKVLAYVFERQQDT